MAYRYTLLIISFNINKKFALLNFQKVNIFFNFLLFLLLIRKMFCSSVIFDIVKNKLNDKFLNIFYTFTKNLSHKIILKVLT